MTRQPNPASTQNITKMSSIAVRLMTSSRPSRASSRPATQPSKSEPVIRRVIRASINMDADPATAAATLHPIGLRPNAHSPRAICTFPNGGCAENTPPGRKMSVALPDGSCEPKKLIVRSAPECRIPNACGT